jgi:hypothetical protein
MPLDAALQHFTALYLLCLLVQTLRSAERSRSDPDAAAEVQRSTAVLAEGVFDASYHAYAVIYLRLNMRHMASKCYLLALAQFCFMLDGTVPATHRLHYSCHLVLLVCCVCPGGRAKSSHADRAGAAQHCCLQRCAAC